MTWSATRTDRVLVLGYDRPPDNVIGFEDLAELDDALAAAGQDETVSVLLLTSLRPQVFVAHADPADVERLSTGRLDATRPGPEVWGRALSRMAQIDQPVIAAVDGQAWGGGFELALAAMLRIASPAAHFRLVEVADGAIPGAGGTQRLPRLVGLGTAADLILRSRRIDAAEAHRLGIVQDVLQDEPFVDAATAWAARLARSPRHALCAAKRAVYAGLDRPLEQALDIEQAIFRDTLARRAAVVP